MKVQLLLIFLFFSVAIASADNAGSRGAYTRGGWAGAKYAASGMTGEVIANDIFSIYWNPAGLTELKVKKKLNEKQITEKAKEGKIDEITEDDLLNFSDSGSDRLFFNIGASYTKLDIERDAGFAGFAFNFFKGVLGIGLYSITSTGIETRDESGDLTGTQNYSGSEGFLSYAVQWNIMSLGVSLKGYYEAIGESTYSGFGGDAGVQVFILPFIKVGVMVRDAVGYLKPYDAPESEKRNDFLKPQITTGIAILTDAGIKISFSGSKKLEQTDFDYGAGVEYAISKYFIINTGLCDNYFSAGFTIRLLDMDIAYAINFDRVDMGYNNTVSVAVLF
jgi:hypothetical protein